MSEKGCLGFDCSFGANNHLLIELDGWQTIGQLCLRLAVLAVLAATSIFLSNALPVGGILATWPRHDYDLGGGGGECLAAGKGEKIRERGFFLPSLIPGFLDGGKYFLKIWDVYVRISLRVAQLILYSTIEIMHLKKVGVNSIGQIFNF